MAKDFGIAPPASRKVEEKKRVNRMPLHVGKAIRVNKLTPQEEEELIRMGWEKDQPIPENLADLMEEARQIEAEALDVDNLPPPVPLDTKPFKYDPSNDVSIEQLPPQQQANYKKLMRDVFAKAATRKEQEEAAGELVPDSAGDGVAATIRKAVLPGSDIEIEDDSEEFEPQGSQETAPKHEQCPRCSFPLDQKDMVVVTNEDKDLYQQSIDALQLFEKTFDLVGGRLKVVVRELTVSERRAVHNQLIMDQDKKRFRNLDEMKDQLFGYNLALQTIKVTTKEQDYNAPKLLKNWKFEAFDEDVPVDDTDSAVRKAYFKFVSREWPEMVEHQLSAALIEFDMLQAKLEANSREPGFWTPRTDAS